MDGRGEEGGEGQRWKKERKKERSENGEKGEEVDFYFARAQMEPGLRLAKAGPVRLCEWLNFFKAKY